MLSSEERYFSSAVIAKYSEIYFSKSMLLVGLKWDKLKAFLGLIIFFITIDWVEYRYGFLAEELRSEERA